MGKTPKFFKATAIVTLIFLVLISFDLTPYLRGPAPYFPDWRWEYLYIPTWDKVWVPGAVGFLIILFAKSNFNTKAKNDFLFLSTVVILGITFNLSITHFERSGINVLVARVIDPGNNGYFTTATEITNTAEFINSYDKRVLSLHQHAEGHPPGAILLHRFINNSFRRLNLDIHLPSPSTERINDIWQNLEIYERQGAIASIAVILVLSNLSAIVMFYIAKHLYDIKTAKIASILTILIPASSYFYPLPNSYYPLLGLLPFLFLIKKSKFHILFSGLIYSVALFFSFSILPLFLFYILFIFLHNMETIKEALRKISIFIFSIVSFYFLLFLVSGYNIAQVFLTVMNGLPENRSYLTWLLYNPYDFLIFAGIPVSMLFIFSLRKYVSLLMQSNDKLTLASINSVLFSGTMMFVLLVASGIVRGEVGRIWLPLMPFVALFAAQFIASTVKRPSIFVGILLLIIIQTIVQQEFWVMLW